GPRRAPRVGAPLREGAPADEARLLDAGRRIRVHGRRAPARRRHHRLRRTIDDDALNRLRTTLNAGWRSFDAAADHARGKTLAKGPRGGGRDLAKIVEHVGDAEGSYLRMLGRQGREGCEGGPGRRHARGDPRRSKSPPATAHPPPGRGEANDGSPATSSVAWRSTSSTTRGRSRIGRRERP